MDAQNLYPKNFGFCKILKIHENILFNSANLYKEKKFTEPKLKIDIEDGRESKFMKFLCTCLDAMVILVMQKSKSNTEFIYIFILIKK